MAAQSSQFQEETRSNLRNTGASVKNLEMQMSQIAQQLAGSQAPGALPSATITNPREHNNVSVVTTRSGKSKEVPEKDDKEEDQLLEVELEIKENEVVSEEVVVPKLVVKEKDIISKKRSIDTDPIVLTETCSAILQGMKIPVKKKDRGSVTIPCTIGDKSYINALIDLGASVSLMSLSIYKRLGIGKMQDTRMTLQFVDTSLSVY
ncbi:uncharacterized protein LOC127102202 [Lathyrus oleraceus]|uniref:uncharacterized protein LOC127102202 n=1 Tax=Pisum sativum TaxID=3888 RepID=UPI0021CE19E0|nr:uncharacterized protein LOC127102202 [Pisum sativum]